MKVSKIAWTDYSGGAANIVLRGKADCPISEGCVHCYMGRLDQRFGLLPRETTIYPDKLRKLAEMKFPRYSFKRGRPWRPMVFVADGGDLFHENVPDEFLWETLTVLRERPDVAWQILTKRAERMRDVVTRYVEQYNLPELPDSLWLGVTAENQARADERIPLLLQTPAAVRFVSCEPLLGPIKLVGRCFGRSKCFRRTPEPEDHPCHCYENAAYWPGDYLFPDWIICGGESGGPEERYMDLDWARSLRAQCQEARVPFFFKQQSGPMPGMGVALDGEVIQQWPGFYSSGLSRGRPPVPGVRRMTSMSAGVNLRWRPSQTPSLWRLAKRSTACGVR